MGREPGAGEQAHQGSDSAKRSGLAIKVSSAITFILILFISFNFLASTRGIDQK